MVQIVKPEPGWADYLGQGLGQAIEGGLQAYQTVKKEQRLQQENDLAAEKEKRLAWVAEQRAEVERGNMMMNVLKMPPGKRGPALTYLAPSLGLDMENPNTKNLLKLVDSDDEATQAALVKTFGALVPEGQVGAYLAIAQEDPGKAMELALRLSAKGGGKDDRYKVVGGDLLDVSGDEPRVVHSARGQQKAPTYLPAVQLPNPDKPGETINVFPPKEPGGQAMAVGADGRLIPYTGSATPETRYAPTQKAPTEQQAKYGLYAQGEQDLATIEKLIQESGVPGYWDTILQGIKQNVAGATGYGGAAAGAAVGRVLGSAGGPVGQGVGAAAGAGLGYLTGTLAGPAAEQGASFLQSDKGKRFFAASSRMRDSIEKAMTGASASDRERLQYVLGNIPSPSDDAATVADKLVKLRSQFNYMKTVAGGRRPSSDEAPPPNPSTTRPVGTRARNKRTGQIGVWDGTKWVPE